MSEQRVAKRKTHTKSRKGCFQCKQRHTKCNEARPRCANCVRLDINCQWPAIPDGFSASPHPSLSDHASPIVEFLPPKSPDLAQKTGNFELSLPDLRLLHHWTTKAYKASFPILALKSDIWQVGLIELGFDFPFLLHGLLALSAVHKASFFVPTDRQDLLLQADVHISQALETMRKNLESPSEKTAIPMFVLSSVLLTYNFGTVQEKPSDPIGSLHHCFMLLHGIKVVIGPYWQTAKDNPLIAPMVEMSSHATLQMLDTLAEDDTFPEILRLMELTELVLDALDKEACAAAIQDLHDIAIRFRHISQDRDENSFLFLWPARMTNRFFELLAAHNPVACVITVHFAALLAQVRPLWWVLKWPKYLLIASEQLLAKTPDLLRWLDWPQSIINANPTSTAATSSSS